MNMSRNPHRDQRGFTLTELMVIAGVLGVLFGIAIPSIQSQIARQQLGGSARQLVEVLRSARDSAVNEGVPRFVLLRPGRPATYRVYRYDGTAWIPDENEVPLQGSVGFDDADLNLPALSEVPVSGAGPLPTGKGVYFDTRGAYPHGYDGPYTITLRGRSGDPIELTIHAGTGQVTGA